MKIPDTYFLKNGFYIRKEKAPFNYSDGDGVENYLADIFEKASDLTTGSEELFLAITDWPTRYHLSPQRANLLRPFAQQLQGKTILEVGCGCGAITRFLGELGCTVIALEGSERRAKLTASRCRDLSNVTVICDRFQDLELEEQFDFVTLIGVLEYANLYLKDGAPHLKMLQEAKSYLKADGQLIIAIENKLGLKYWAGTSEDHLGKPYIGLEGKYNSQTAETFGKAELTHLIYDAGFATASFLYPFPDYKLPDVVLTEQAFVQEGFNVQDLLLEKFDYFQDQQYQTNFSTTLVSQNLIKNQLLPELSNSFLVRVSLNGIKEKNNALAYTYSSLRRKEFCKENVLTLTEDGSIEVVRNYLYQNGAFSGVTISNAIANDKYINGHLLFKDLISIVSSSGWSLHDVSTWAQRYYQVLVNQAYIKNGTPWLKGVYIDLTPFNIVLSEDNSATVFDLEWYAKEDLPLYYIFFRGIIYSIGRITFYEAPEPGTPCNIIQLAAAIVNTIIPFTEEQLNYCFKKELFLFSEVVLGEINPFGFYNIIIRKDYKKGFETLHQQLQEKQNYIESMHNQMEDFKKFMLENVTSLLSQRDHEHEGQYIQSQNALKKEWLLATDQLNQEVQRLQQEIKQQAGTFEATLRAVESANADQSKVYESLLQRLQQEIKQQAGTFEATLKAVESVNADQSKAYKSLKQELETLQKELDWYKRTYEYRSFLGVIKEKIRSSIKK